MEITDFNFFFPEGGKIKIAGAALLRELAVPAGG
jgi:hypothetical protein